MPDDTKGNGHTVIPEILWYSCDGMMVIDGDRRILAVNPAMEQITGHKARDLVGKGECGVLLSCQDLEGCSLAEQPWKCPGLKAMHSFEPVSGAEYTLQTGQGRRRAVSSSYTPIQLPDHPVWALVILRDITLQKRREARFIRQAKTDVLTGLPNRAALLEAIQKEVKRAERNARPLAIGMADIDGFKRYNDAFGHPAGDELLKVLAGLLRTGRRLPDLVCRYGGDEFVLLLPETDAAGAGVVTERLCRTLSRFPFARRANPGMPEPAHPIEVSIGVAVFPGDGKDPQELLARADSRLYEAKHQGGNRVVGPF